MLHVVCTCTLFGDTICLLTNWIYCIDIWLLTLLFSLQYLIEPCFGNDITIFITQPSSQVFFHLPNLLLTQNFVYPTLLSSVPPAMCLVSHMQACSARADFPKFKVETAFWCSHGNIRSHVIRLQITPDEDTRVDWSVKTLGRELIQLGFAFTYKNPG
jgi:hypothetical protein